MQRANITSSMTQCNDINIQCANITDLMKVHNTKPCRTRLHSLSAVAFLVIDSMIILDFLQLIDNLLLFISPEEYYIFLSTCDTLHVIIRYVLSWF